jgi:hypothetical protein
MFTESFVGGQKGQEEKDPKKLLSLQEFIGVIKEEYVRRLMRMPKESGSQAMTSQAMVSKPSLAKRIGAPTSASGNPAPQGKMFCRQCKQRNHYTSDCNYLGMDKCDECGRFGHLAKHCWNKQMWQKRKNENSNNNANKSMRPPKKARQEETHATIEECIAAMDRESQQDIVIGEAEDEELIVFSAIGGDEDLYADYDEYNSFDGNDINITLLSSDWLADSATTSHITNQRDLLTEYKPTPNLKVAGVGNVSAAVQGKGAVILHTEFKGCKYNL